MEDKKYIVISKQVYDNVVSYLVNTQIYKNVAPLISEIVEDVNENAKKFALSAIPKLDTAPAADVDARIVDEESK